MRKLNHNNRRHHQNHQTNPRAVGDRETHQTHQTRGAPETGGANGVGGFSTVFAGPTLALCVALLAVAAAIGVHAFSAGPAQAQFAPSTTETDSAGIEGSGIEGVEDAAGEAGDAGAAAAEEAGDALPEAAPGGSLADERQANGAFSGEDAAQEEIQGAQEDGQDYAEDYASDLGGEREDTGAGAVAESPASADGAPSAGSANNAAPDAASTPTGGMELFGAPPWLVGAVFALGFAALALMAVRRRQRARDTAAVGTGAIFEKRRRGPRRRVR